MKLLCQKFQLSASAIDSPRVSASFVLPISPQEIDEIADAFKNITKFMGEEIEIVRAQEGKLRCFYCGQLNRDDELECQSCGGRLE